MERNKATIIILLCLALCFQTGCLSPDKHRLNADKAAKDIIREQQKQVLGIDEAFDIERPSDILRRRLLIKQKLAYSGPSSLGTDQLEQIEHWPEKDYPKAVASSDANITVKADKPVRLSLMQALQVSARNSSEYQSRKEEVFRSALAFDLELDAFRNTFAGQLGSLVSTNSSGDKTVSGTETSGMTGLKKKLQTGAEISSNLSADLVHLLTANGASSLGLTADATIAVPLLRGSGKHIVTEPLTQAQRDMVYSIYEFERFKRIFAVNIASEYLGVLRQLDQVKNTRDNYRSLMLSARRSRRLADAGRLSEIQVDQTVQNELRARDRWIAATESYKSRIDSFKILLGLPPDAMVELEQEEMNKLVAPALKVIEEISLQEQSQTDKKVPAADEPIELIPADRKNAGPLEIDESLATKLSLDNRLDLRVAQGGVYDAQRAVVVLADSLGAELTFFGSADLGSSRSLSSATLDNARLRTNKGTYSGLLNLDLAFERTAERNAYRNGFINLERTVREVQRLEDQIKLSVRNKLRDMIEARQGLQIQAKAVYIAEKRVKSTNMFLEADRATIRDLLEAQDSLLSAKNGLTASAINYRIAELELQRDMGLLKVDKNGLWQEYSPEGIDHVKQ